MMETRIIEYPRTGGLDYHQNSPLIGEIPTNDYTHFHRSIDQLRSLNERGILNTNHIQNVLVQPSNSPIPIAIIHASGVYNEIKLSDEQKVVSDFQSTSKMRRNVHETDENISEDFQLKKDLSNNNNNNNVNVNNFRIIHSPQQYTITTSSISSPLNPNLHPNNFSSVENLVDDEEQDKSKVRKEFLIKNIFISFLIPHSLRSVPSGVVRVWTF